jgi:nitroimidazol reductase NimA-like FMN-containing flavoprotein (pyridoxamine 5'-phosphate oxidase superfamily)
MCHIGHIIRGRPVVIPTVHWRDGDDLYWHGSAASRMLEANAVAGEVCLTASIIDGWVVARSGFHHSVNYRSVMCFGRPRGIYQPEEKLLALRGFIERMFPGRWDQLRPPTAKELKATLVATMPIDEASAKVRALPPVDDPEDLGWPVWAGVLPLTLVRGQPAADAYVLPELEPPAGW